MEEMAEGHICLEDIFKMILFEKMHNEGFVHLLAF